MLMEACEGFSTPITLAADLNIECRASPGRFGNRSQIRNLFGRKMALLEHRGFYVRATRVDYQEIIDRRRALVIEPYKSLADVGFDGPWVTPYQITSKSAEGPVLVALHWLMNPRFSETERR